LLCQSSMFSAHKSLPQWPEHRRPLDDPPHDRFGRLFPSFLRD
jgi:hypothetical protein